MTQGDEHRPHRHGHRHAGAPPPTPPEETRKPAPAEVGQSAAEEPQLAEIKKALETRTREYKELVDQLQRLAAEYANYQKRIERTLQDQRRLGVRDMALDLLPALDNLDRTLAAAKDAPDLDALLAGVRLVRDQVLAALQKHGVSPIEAAGQPFNPEHHEAVALLPSESHPEGNVMEEVQKGYKMDGRTIRATRVAVSSGAPKPETPAQPPVESLRVERQEGADVRHEPREAEGNDDADV
jgi:molecular chaperone GrpE